MLPIFHTIMLLVLSIIFMTFAWYGHLRNPGSKPLSIAILVSRAIALAVSIAFVRFWGGEKLELDFLWGSLCMCGAA